MAGERILLVDDEPSLRELLREILEEAGYAVTTAGNGKQALGALDAAAPELVISDVNMPGMDGYELYRQVRARPRFIATPFLFLSGRSGETDVRAGKQMGADEYLTKPVHEADLLIAVRARLDRRAAVEAAHASQLERLKRDILETLNHEFRTPLTVLVGYGQMLREHRAQLTPETLDACVDGILAGSERLERLVKDLVLLVDLHSGAAERAFEQKRQRLEDVAALLEDAVAAQRARAEVRKVQLTADVAADLPAVNGQRDLLSDAMARLIGNGIKFAKREGGTVAVRARAGRGPAGQEQVQVEVRDDGVGMPEDQLERITALFYQVDRERTEQQGTGAGLTIARAVAAMHGGTLEVSSALGVGSTFTLTLPAAPAGDR
jgi:signal transduction histidine kinase